jgi:hypothetical protein
MKNYLYLEINDWSINDLEGFSVVSVLDNTDHLKINTDLKVGQNEKFYFLPGVTIPRIKLKDLYANTKSKTVRDITEATIVISGDKTSDKLYNSPWHYWVKTESLKELLGKFLDDGSLESYKYDDFMLVLETYTEPIILGAYNLSKLCSENGLIGGVDYAWSSDKFFTVDPDYQELYNNIHNVNIYNEDCLIELVNGKESTTINKDMYETLTEMLYSNDNDNHVLAMEIMANSNYKESLLYLCMIFEQFSHVISNSRSRNHVNFKSLTKYMGFSSPTYCSMNKDNIIKLLMERDVFTKEMGIELLTKYKNQIEVYGESDYFKVSKITFNDEVINYLKEKQNVTNPE